MKKYKITQYVASRGRIAYAVYRRELVFFWELLQICSTLEEAKAAVEVDKKYPFRKETIEGYY